MQLSEHFSLQEFVASNTAAQLGIDNTLPDDLLEEAKKTAAMFERIRSYLSHLANKDVPITLTSGYRCLALNRAKKSKDTSDHVRARAGDFHAPAFGTPYQIAMALAPVADDLGIGQLIYEFDSWVHASTWLVSKSIDRIITINANGTRVGIQKD